MLSLRYDEKHEEQRFLVNNLLQEGNKLPITIVLNWAANLKR